MLSSKLSILPIFCRLGHCFLEKFLDHIYIPSPLCKKMRTETFQLWLEYAYLFCQCFGSETDYCYFRKKALGLLYTQSYQLGIIGQNPLVPYRISSALFCLAGFSNASLFSLRFLMSLQRYFITILLQAFGKMGFYKLLSALLFCWGVFRRNLRDICIRNSFARV